MKRSLTAALAAMICVGTWADGDALFKQGASLFGTEPEKAFPLFVAAAEEGHVSAMVGAAHCLENGTGAERDYAQAIAWYEKAVEQNNLKACEGLARIYASCPEPKFHDGEKAVKYASAVVRKNPRDPDSLSLLAAAHARNLDFEQATRYINKAGSIETRTDEAKLLKQRKEAYQQGEPYPPIATQEWMLEALEKDSSWAMSHMVRRIADPFDPLYDTARATGLCESMIKAGNKALYLFLGNIYLDAGDLDDAHDAYGRFVEYLIENRDHSRPPQLIYLSYIDRPVLEVMKKVKLRRDWWLTVNGSGVDGQGREYGYGGEYASLEESMTYCPQVDASRIWNPPNMGAVHFLLKIAAVKGDPAARKELAALEERMKHSRMVLENKDNLDHTTWSARLNEEALKYCNNNVFPVNIPLAEEFYRKSYEINPTARTACILGMLHLRDYLYPDHYRSRSIDEAVRWLNIAHGRGMQAATRRLIEAYACDQDAEVCNGELALKYATEYAAAHPSNDHEALRLLACAYARNEQFENAIQTIKNALEFCPDSEGDAKSRYRAELAAFEKHKPSYMNLQANRYYKGSMLFADWVQKLEQRCSTE